MHFNPQIDPIYKRGHNGAGVLLLHGFTGTPDSLRPVANALIEEGFTVLAPLLAGHGQTPEACAATGWHDWMESVQKAYMELREQCTRLFVCGLSLGGLLALKLVIDNPQAFSGLSCLATPIELKAWARRLLKAVWYSPLRYTYRFQKKVDVDIKDQSAKANFWNYDLMPVSCVASLVELQALVRSQLSGVTCPLLLMHSRHDNTAPYESMGMIAGGVSSAVTEMVTLENSYHVITLDFEKDLVASRVTQFFKRFL